VTSHQIIQRLSIRAERKTPFNLASTTGLGRRAAGATTEDYVRTDRPASARIGSTHGVSRRITNREEARDRLTI
tara:strand:- start:65 stop:286 length:222 start_codon:yes stop_codon:yes gene_type:complete